MTVTFHDKVLRYLRTAKRSSMEALSHKHRHERERVCCREVERVHAAVLGAHVRSCCLLPLEMYLEEGIPLVCYLRDQPHAELVETSEQSCHAFLSFSNVAAATPALKVGCIQDTAMGHDCFAARPCLPSVMLTLCKGSPPKAVLLYALYADFLLGAARLWRCPAAICRKSVSCLCSVSFINQFLPPWLLSASSRMPRVVAKT